MEIDLAQAEADLDRLAETLRSQVCLVGGGIAGLLLAHKLAHAGVGVTLLEAGGRDRDAVEAADPFAAELQGRSHAGTREGRVRALGGSSITWGGQLLPLPEDAAWPVSAAELRSYEAEAEQQFGVDSLPYGADEFFRATGAAAPSILAQDKALVQRLSKFVPFGRRNLASTVGRELLAHPRVKVVLHASVVELVLASARDRIEGVVLCGPAGKRIQVNALHFVLAAGTVETCRLLLASRTVAPEGVGNGYGQVGANFHDHLTLPAATFTGASRSFVLRELRPWVYRSAQGSTVHSLKLELGTRLRGLLGLNAGMAHVTIEEPEDSGPALVKELLRARQQGSLGRALRGHAVQMPLALMETARMGWSARVQHRRYVSPRAAVRLYLNTAQDAASESRVLLSEDRDRMGVGKAVVRWSVSRSELESLRRFAGYLQEVFKPSAVGEGTVWEPALFASDVRSDESLCALLDDARHAMGGACMGSDPRTSVVDAELRVHGIENLSVASAAVFPDGSPQLPTLTLAALALRLADRLKKQLT